MEMKNFLRVTFILLTLVVCGSSEVADRFRLDGPGGPACDPKCGPSGPSGVLPQSAAHPEFVKTQST